MLYARGKWKVMRRHVKQDSYLNIVLKCFQCDQVLKVQYVKFLFFVFIEVLLNLLIANKLSLQFIL